MNIVFVFDGLQVGGIERVGVDYINLLSAREYKISVVNLTPSLNELYHQLPDSCQIYEMNLSRSMVPYRYAKGAEKGIFGAVVYATIGSLLLGMNIVRKVVVRRKLVKLQNTDIVIAFSGHFNDLMFVASTYIPGEKIAWLHGAEFEYKMISEGYFALYRKIKNLVCLSELCDITCSKFNKENGIKKTLIYNPVLIQARGTDKEKVEQLKCKYGKFTLMTGRLTLEKDQKTAILAIKHLNKTRQEKICLLLAGDGVLKEDLEAFVIEQKASDYVYFLGNCLDMQNYYSAAYVYVHSSPMEGLPTVLLEALTYGVPIAATDSIPGVREILGNNEYGLISPVKDWEELAENIGRLYDDDELRKNLIEGGKRRIMDFNPDLIIEKLEAYLNTLRNI